MAELKTKRNRKSVAAFLNGIPDAGKRADALAIAKLMQAVTRSKPGMWGDSIIGFGSYQYKYESGRALEWFQTGFSPRKQNLTLYIMPGFDRYGSLLKKLGKFSTGKACLYIKRLEDVDVKVLRELLEASVKFMARAK
jgi:hypothetical protein